MAAFSSGQVSVSTSATAVLVTTSSGSNSGPPQVAVKNLGPVVVWVGGSSSVSPSTGFPLMPGEVHVQTILGGAGTTLYGVTGADTSRVAFLLGG